MANFYEAIDHTLRWEGTFVNDPDDPGGATNMGITIGTFRRVAKKLLGIEPTIDNLKALTPDQAKVIYKAEYWDKIHGDEIDCQPLANIIFDFYVNAGNNAVSILQTVLNSLLSNLDIDGSFGPKTLTALRDHASLYNTVYSRYRSRRETYYKNLAKRRPSLKKYLNGWLNRVNSFPKTL